MNRLDRIERYVAADCSDDWSIIYNAGDIRALVAVARAAVEYMEAPPSANVKAAIKMANALAPLLESTGPRQEKAL